MSKPNAASFPRFLLWLAALFGLAVGVAAAAPRIEASFSPLGILPLLLGGSLGLAGAVAAAFLREDRVPLRMLGGLLAGLICAAGSHYTSYLWLQQRMASNDLTPQERSIAMMVAPRTFQEFLQQEVERGRDVDAPGLHRRLNGHEVWILWGIEAALLSGAAAFAAAVGARPEWLPPSANLVRRGTLSAPPPDWLSGRFDLPWPEPGKSNFALYFDAAPPGRFGLETTPTAGGRSKRQWVWVAMEEYRPLNEWLGLDAPSAEAKGPETPS